MRPFSVLGAVFALTRVAQCLSSTLTQVQAFVSTSQDIAMYVYIPDTGPTTETQAIVVAIHSCERSAEYYFENTGYAALADQYGYIVIYPNASTPTGCWDTTTSKSLTRNGGGDSQAIANMVTYAVKNLNGNSSRVAVTGSSSGGVMVNLLAGIYPDVFQAASVFSGQYANSIWTYSGSRPKMMIYHGTVDETYPYANLGEELKGWSDVLDVTFSHNVSDTPVPGYTEMVYGDGLKLVGVSAAGVGHTVPVNAVADLAWFCISPECGEDGLPVVSSASPTSSTSSTTSPSSESSMTSSPSTTSISPSLTSGEATTTSPSSAASTAASNTLASESSSSPSPLVITSAHSKLSSGAKAGISIAVAALALLFIVAAAFLIRKRRNRVAEPKLDHKMVSLEPEGHEYHSGYGVVPVHDAGQAGGIIEKHQAQMDPKVASTKGFLAHTPGEHYRDSTTSTLLPPRSPGADQRYSTTSSTMLLDPSFREDQRFSTASTMLLPHTADDGEQDISDISYRA